MGGVPIGPIAGGASGGVVLIALAVFFVKRKKGGEEENKNEGNTALSMAPKHVVPQSSRQFVAFETVGARVRVTSNPLYEGLGAHDNPTAPAEDATYDELPTDGYLTVGKETEDGKK